MLAGHRYAEAPRPSRWYPPRRDLVALAVCLVGLGALVLGALVAPPRTAPLRDAVPTVGFSAPPRQVPARADPD